MTLTHHDKPIGYNLHGEPEPTPCACPLGWRSCEHPAKASCLSCGASVCHLCLTRWRWHPDQEPIDICHDCDSPAARRQLLIDLVSPAVQEAA